MDRAFRDVVRRSMSFAQLKSSPKLASSSEIRKTFTDYFCEEHKHLYIRSSPVFSLKDPTLAFTNAGMNQFKDVFLGLVEPASGRVANSQKCIRIGGAHNDLDQVGQDGSHHTFFEMLGNWSFGDYFKEDACRMSWNLLTEVYKIPPERLYVTYFGGDDSLGLSPDVEVQEIWRQIGVKDSHILAFGTKENFWSGSPTGPCGPCTEIHYDHCDERTDAANLVNSGSDEVTELWNLVFTQFDRKESGELVKLKKHFVDTGMGLERLVAVLQGKTSNYDTDLFLPLFEVIERQTGHSGYTGKYDGNAIDCGYRVLADHSRMIAVALSDGMIPNHQNKVRAVIRKSLNVVEKIFRASPDLLKELSNHVAEILSDAYPEIGKNLPKIHYILDSEVETVRINNEQRMLQWKKMKKSYPALSDINIEKTPQMLSALDYFRKNMLSQGKSALTGEDVFVLYDTYGVPVHVTEQLASKLGLRFDMTAYLNYEQSRKATDKENQHKRYIDFRNETSHLSVLEKLEEKKIRPTLDYFKHDYRVDGNGKYIFTNQETTVEAILCRNELVDEITAAEVKDDQEIGLILDRTQLFAEEGNQASDCGTLTIEREIVFDIKKLIKIKDFVIHFGTFRNFPSEGKVSVHDLGVLQLDENRRLDIMRNHTGLHLVNAFLRQELDVTVEKSSSVTPEKLALKFLVYKKNLHLTDEENSLPLTIKGLIAPHILISCFWHMVALRPRKFVRLLASLDEDCLPPTMPTADVLKLEKFVRDFIVHGVNVKRTILNHEQFQALDDVVFVPGEKILSREIPVVEINSGFKLSREYCPGTHLLNTSHLTDLVVMKFRKGSDRIQKIQAVTGEKCAQIRKCDAEIQEKWSRLKSEISNTELPHPSELYERDRRLKQFYSEVESKVISHAPRTTVMSEITEERKGLTNLLRVSIRNFLKNEVDKVSKETSEKFVVHCVDCCWDFSPNDLEAFSEHIAEKSVFVLLKYRNSISIQCIVPETFVSDTFTAREWLTESALCVGGIAKCKSHQNPNLFFHLYDRKATQAQIDQIMVSAVKMAKNSI